MSAHFEKAERFKNEGRFDEAIDELRLALRLDPGCTEAILGLAHLFYLSKQLPESISSFIHAEARGAKLDAEDLFILGEAYAAKSFHRKAIESYDRSLALADQADTHFARGTSFLKLQEFDNAAQCYLNVLRLNPDNTEAHFSLASVLAEKGDFSKALVEYEEWITTQQGNAWARHCVAVAQLNTGNPSGALEEVRTILCDNPQDSQAFFVQGCAYSSIGNIAQAIEALENCLKFNTHHPLALVLLTHLHRI